jgi:hypothetical protein
MSLSACISSVTHEMSIGEKRKGKKSFKRTDEENETLFL